MHSIAQPHRSIRTLLGTFYDLLQLYRLCCMKYFRISLTLLCDSSSYWQNWKKILKCRSYKIFSVFKQSIIYTDIIFNTCYMINMAIHVNKWFTVFLCQFFILIDIKVFEINYR